MSWRPTRNRTHVSLPHYRGLDGLRGLAVLAVILYHGGVSWVPGGLLGVEMFFVLSGFLITSLLLTEWARSATIGLRAFWARRARRLLPALFALVLVIGIYYAVAGSTKAVPGLEDDGISTLFYFNNWHQIANGTSYFAATGPISPLQHTWSLAIEEQFYLVWPLVVLGVLVWARRRGLSGRPALEWLFALSLLGVLASAVDMALQFGGGHGLDRVYYGTDTRATGLLIGAMLAIALTIRRRWPHRRTRRVLTPAQRRLLGRAALVSLVALVAGVLLVGGSTSWLYPYGFLGVDLAVASLILAAVLAPRSAAARVLSTGPLRDLGKISYGLYLWHFPLFLWLDEGSTGLAGWQLLAVRLGMTLAVSVASYRFVEQPIRRGRRPAWQLRTLAPVGAGAALVSLLMASAAVSLPVGVPPPHKLPKAPVTLAGAALPCTAQLTDTPQYGLAPVAPGEEARFEYKALGSSSLVWHGSGRKRFTTCPPKRVMVVGDSVAFTLGLPMMDNEQDYGLELVNAAQLGCAFSTRGQLDVNGTWESPPAQCVSGLSRWAQEENALHVQEVVVELGYRDEFNWLWNGQVVHLGEPAFDAYVQQQIDRYVQVLGRNGVKILFLSVPYTHPPDRPDGAPPPAADPQRRALINAMLHRTAAEHPGTVQLLDIDSIISPGHRYNARIDGELCRFDGIHFTVFCSKLLEPTVMGEARKLLAGAAAQTP